MEGEEKGGESLEAGTKIRQNGPTMLLKTKESTQSWTPRGNSNPG